MPNSLAERNTVSEHPITSEPSAPHEVPARRVVAVQSLRAASAIVVSSGPSSAEVPALEPSAAVCLGDALPSPGARAPAAAPVAPRFGKHLLEALLLTLAFPAVGFVLRPSDPFLLDAPFPWLVLAPLLCGVQHGLLLALVSAGGLFLGAWMHTDSVAWLLGQPHFAALARLFPWGTGCLLAALIAGHFGDRWRGLSARLRAQSEENTEKLTRLNRVHGVMQLSHARLEERLSAERWSLESCVEDAERQMAALTSVRELGRIVLELLVNHALVQSASLFVPDQEGAGESVSRPLQLRPLVTLGAASECTSVHPLVQRAYATCRLQAVVDSLDEAEGVDAAVLAAVPLASSRGRLIGVVAIHEMPFMAFQSEHLSRLALLTARLADLVEDRLEVSGVALDEEALPPVPLERKKSGLFRIQTPTPPAAVAWQSQSRKTRS